MTEADFRTFASDVLDRDVKRFTCDAIQGVVITLQRPTELLEIVINGAAIINTDQMLMMSMNRDTSGGNYSSLLDRTEYPLNAAAPGPYRADRGDSIAIAFLGWSSATSQNHLLVRCTASNGQKRKRICLGQSAIAQVVGGKNVFSNSFSGIWHNQDDRVTEIGIYLSSGGSFKGTIDVRVLDP